MDMILLKSYVSKIGPLTLLTRGTGICTHTPNLAFWLKRDSRTHFFFLFNAFHEKLASPQHLILFD
jgi:hypothetical protein